MKIAGVAKFDAVSGNGGGGDAECRKGGSGGGRSQKVTAIDHGQAMSGMVCCRNGRALNDAKKGRWHWMILAIVIGIRMMSVCQCHVEPCACSTER